MLSKLDILRIAIIASFDKEFYIFVSLVPFTPITIPLLLMNYFLLRNNFIFTKYFINYFILLCNDKYLISLFFITQAFIYITLMILLFDLYVKQIIFMRYPDDSECTFRDFIFCNILRKKYMLQHKNINYYNNKIFNETCFICLNTFTNNDELLIFRCKHGLHLDCIDIDQVEKCYVCRK